MTMDIDLTLDMGKDNLIKFINAMKFLGLVPRAPVSAESLLDPEKRRIMVEEKNALVFTFIDNNHPFRQVDIFITDKISYTSLKNNVEIINIDNFKIKLASKEMLLKMKKSIKPPRDKDIFDIHVLEKIIDQEGS